MSKAATKDKETRFSRVPKKRRAAWANQIRLWHWVSSAICLAGLLFFAVTGITLNHASEIEAAPTVERWAGTIPLQLLQELRLSASRKPAVLPPDLAAWLERTIGMSVGDRPIEWSKDEAYIAMPRPGGDAWVSIETASGTVTFERTQRGAISFLNDLHKARHTGSSWRWFLDIFSGACLVFAATGLLLLYLHTKSRPTTWPLVMLGVGIPTLIAIFSIH